MQNFQSAATVLPLPVQPIRFKPTSRARAIPARKTRTVARANFAEFMELGLTTLVFAAAFLFAAGLLHYGVPACPARQIGVMVLDGCGVALSVAATFAVARGLLRLA